MQPLMDLDLIAMLNAIADEHEETVRTFARRWVAQLVSTLPCHVLSKFVPTVIKREVLDSRQRELL